VTYSGDKIAEKKRSRFMGVPKYPPSAHVLRVCPGAFIPPKSLEQVPPSQGEALQAPRTRRRRLQRGKEWEWSFHQYHVTSVQLRCSVRTYKLICGILLYQFTVPPCPDIVCRNGIFSQKYLGVGMPSHSAFPLD